MFGNPARTKETPVRTALCLVPILFVAVSAPARAHDRWAVNGGPYLDVGGGSEFVNLPEPTAFTRFGAGEFGGIDDEFWTWRAEAALGFVDSEGTTLFDPLGQNARIELRGRYTHGTSDRSDAGDLIFLNPPEPAPLAILLANDLPALSNTMLETWEAELTWQTDVVVSDRVAISPLVGLTYTRLRFENDYKVVFPGFFSQELNDETKTNYYGVALGADVTFRPVPAVDLVLGVQADLMGADAWMHANLGTIDRSDEDSSFAARTTASLGAGFTWGPLTLRAEGFFRYLSYLATADAPIRFTDDPTHIDGEAMWSAGGRGSLTLSF